MRVVVIAVTAKDVVHPPSTRRLKPTEAFAQGHIHYCHFFVVLHSFVKVEVRVQVLSEEVESVKLLGLVAGGPATKHRLGNDPEHIGVDGDVHVHSFDGGMNCRE